MGGPRPAAKDRGVQAAALHACLVLELGGSLLGRFLGYQRAVGCVTNAVYHAPHARGQRRCQIKQLELEAAAARVEHQHPAQTL